MRSCALHDVVTLRPQLLRHPVKGFAELRQVAFRLAHRNAHIKVSGRNGIGGANKPPDRRNQPVGKIQSDPDCREQHRQRDHGVHQRERHLHAGSARFERCIFCRARTGCLKLRDDTWIEQSRQIKIIVLILVQFDDGRDVIGVRQQNDLRFFTADKRQGIAWRQREGLIDIEIGTRNDFQLLVEHDGCGKAPDLCLKSQKLAKFVGVLVEDTACCVRYRRPSP